MNNMDNILNIMPNIIKDEITKLNLKEDIIEEIRLYRGGKIAIYTDNACLTTLSVIDEKVMTNILNSLIKYSYHSYEDDLAKGFITIAGGNRVGICGKVIIKDNRVSLIKNISSINIRHSKEIKGCSDKIIDSLIDDNVINNVLLVSPPNCGKTTLLRDIGRNLVNKGYKVAICDERSEIAAMNNGISPYSFGGNIDVLDGCPKAIGIEMLIRSMSPDVIITDEIGMEEDIKAIDMCLYSGVKLITSIHGNSIEDIKLNPINHCIENKVFKRIISLCNYPLVGSIKELRVI